VLASIFSKISNYKAEVEHCCLLFQVHCSISNQSISNVKFSLFCSVGKKRLVVSPAFTVLYDLGVQDAKEIDIDLVPAIRIEGWPKTAREICPHWLRDSSVENAMKCFHVVTKTFPGGKQVLSKFIFLVDFRKSYFSIV
jgi:hypothetical protein